MKKRISKGAFARLMAAAMVLSLVPGMAFAVTTPAGQPFSPDTLGSHYWRIPAMVTVDDGTVVAAADARWDHGSDAGDIDTLVSVSDDNGFTWTTPEYVLAAEGDKATFMDPALATDGSTIYMVADVYPAGVAIVGGDKYPSDAKAFDSKGNLLLAANGSSSYKYYLSNGLIYTSAGAVVEGYTVDGKFNLIQNGEIVSNLFYSDAAYQVVPTTFLCLTKSTDGGATWSDYTLLNVKNSGEAFYGVGPGRGVVTDTGRVVFSCYSHKKGTFSNTEYTSFIYSDDGGATWTRTANMSTKGSEAAVTEADGMLFAFSRTSGTDNSSLTYYVSFDNGATWSKKSNSKIDPNTSCEMSAITYSRTINGKTAILLSCAAGKKSSGFLGMGSDNGRKNGKIFVGLVNEDGSLDFSSVSAAQVNGSNEFFAYSCLTELADGSVGIMYECDADSSGTDGIVYSMFTADELFGGAEIGPGNTDSEDTGSGDIGSGDTGSGDTGSGDTGSGDTGSGDTGSGDTGSGDTGSGDTGSGDTGSGDTGSGDTGSGDTGSSDTGSGDTGSDDTGSGDTGSGDTGSGDTGSDDTGSGDTGSGDTGSGDTGSDDTGSGDTGSGDTGSGDTGSDDSETEEDTGKSAFEKWLEKLFGRG